MKTLRFAVPILALSLLAAPLSAQEAGVVDGAELNAALEQHGAQDAADRAVVDRVLSSEAARGVAESIGVDIESARSAVRLLEGERLAEAVQLAQAVEDPIAGGQTISFNTVTVILILLLVIVVILIAK